jgi:ubiquinone/menaquinone biosynthesis C-methylase UbiE
LTVNIFNRYYQKYDAWYRENQAVFFSELKAIKKVLPKTGKELEIGVGTGQFASHLGVKYGIDPSLKMLGLARNRGVKVKLGYGESLPYQTRTFDYVLIIFTLCFVKNPKKVLQETHQVLKQKGKLIIGMIDKHSFLGKYYQSKKSGFYKYAKFFSVSELTNLLTETGFTRFTLYQTLFKLPTKIKLATEPKKGFGKGGFVVVSAVPITQGHA